MSRPAIREQPNGDGDDDQRDDSQDTTNKQHRLSAEAVQSPQASENTDELDNVQYTRHDELHVEIQAHCAKERG